MRAFSIASHRRTGRALSPAGSSPGEESLRDGVGGVAELMSVEIVCVEESATTAELRELLVDRGQHCVPVVAPEGRPVGVVTQTDLLRSLSADGEAETHAGEKRGVADERRIRGAPRGDGATAGEIMTPLVFALPITASVEQAAALMAYEGVDQLVVTDMGGYVAGVVRALDVARRCARSAGYLVDREE